MQDIAARVTNSSSGRHFNAFMAQAYKMPSYLGEFADMNKAVRSLAAKCWRNREGIEKWRTAIGQDKALRMNHPATVWAAYEAAQRPPTERAGAASPFAQLKQEHAKALEEIDRLKKDADISFSRRDTAAVAPQPASRPSRQEARPGAAATARDAKAMERLQARLALAEAMLKTAHRSFSEKTTEAAKLRKEVEALTKDGPQWARNQLAILRQDNAALRREMS